jgi:hypothetical protein
MALKYEFSSEELDTPEWKEKEQYAKEQQFKLLHEILNVPIGSPYNFPKERNMVLDNLMKAHAKLREELQVKPNGDF